MPGDPSESRQESRVCVDGRDKATCLCECVSGGVLLQMPAYKQGDLTVIQPPGFIHLGQERCSNAPLP